MLHKGKPRIFDASKSASNSRIPSTFTIGKNPHLTKQNKLHSKSTYFYRWGSRLNYVVPSVCTLALLVGGIVAINPLINTTGIARANDDFWPSTGDTTSNITLTLNPAGGTADQVTSAKVGEVTYRSNIFSVSQSTSSWYAVLVRAANGYSSDLVNSTNTSARVTGVGKNIPTDGFKENTWGYALTTNTTTDNSTLRYSTVPENSDLTPAFSETSTGKSFKVVFGAKFGPDTPSGNYQTKVYLSAITNPTQVATGFDSISDMQEMTSDICNKAKYDDEKQLTDDRDGKSYWVAKLLDGNCWMTQNLDYDGGGTFTNPSSWSSSDRTFQGYYDPGNYIYNIGSSGQNGNCSDSTFTNCSTQFSTVNSSSNLHYHVGNYYSWNAATVGTGGSITSGEAASSICPKSWKLPASNNTNISGSFAYLLAQYGVNSSPVNGTNAIYKKPLYFSYDGYIQNSRLQRAGDYGSYWTSTPYNSNNYTNYLSFNDTIVNVSSINPSGNNDVYRYAGMPIRCVFIPE